ncbi:MAG: LamG-like jellyroll fold domain-containing protein [Verrucomicrobiota bacterium]
MRLPRLIITTTALPAALFCAGSADGAIKQRWSFTNPAGAAADATEIANLAPGGEAAFIRGAGATFTGTSVSLPGGGSGSAPYVDLPNGIINPLKTATIEAWVTVKAAGNNWARFFDFGSNNIGEISGPGTGFEGNNYLFLAASAGDNYNSQQFEFRVTPGDQAENTTGFQVGRLPSFGTEIYFAITLDNSNPGTTIANYWRNNEHIGTDLIFPYDLSQLNDVNNWLGRSNWSNDGNLNGEFNEFRIHDIAFTEAQVTASRSSGPDTLAADTDGDGMPDAWELANGLTSPTADKDGDGLNNKSEYDNGTNPGVRDTDGDGLEDGPEITAGTLPLNPDTEGDGLKDGAETAAGTNPLDRDTDKDLHGDGSEVASGSNPLVDTSIPTPRLSHRYSFSETAGRKIADSTGGAPVTVLGNGFSLAGGSLTLNGGPSTAAAYAALPAGVLSNNGLAKGGRGAVSLEGWATVNSTAPGVWARLVDFGSNTPGGPAGAIFAPGDWNGGAASGMDYLMITAYTGSDARNRQVELHNDDPIPVTNNIFRTFTHAEQLGTPVHFVFTYDESSGHLAYYEDGVEVASGDVTAGNPLKLSDLNDVNNWLGRSNYNGDANLDGSFSEFRIYDNVLPAETVAAHFAAGPDTAPTPAAEPDADTDGMPDWFERAYGFNPASAADAPLDADGDGLNNRDEALRGSSPLVADTDGDGLSDPAETNTGTYVSATSTGTSPISYDTDGDFAGDNAEVTAGSNPINAGSPPAALVHQWRFNNAAGDASTGTTSPDEIGGAQNAVILGDGAAFTGSGISIPGGGSGSAAYVDLPNNLLSPLTAAAIELWVSIHNDSNSWARIFDFGDTDGNEITGPGGGGGGSDYIFLGAAVGAEYRTNRVEIRNGTNAPAVQGTIFEYAVPFTSGTPELVHYVVSLDSSVAGGSRVNIWRNGQVIVHNGVTPIRLSDLNDVNNWLGRSNYLGDSNLSATYQEFRIYKGLLDPATVAKNFADGPEVPSPAAGFSITSVIRVSPTLVRLTWQSEANKTYIVKSSPNLQSPWGSAAPAVTATSTSTQADITVPANTTRIFYRVERQ